MGGGGAAGSMTPPTYMKGFHNNILTGDEADLASGATPLSQSFAEIYNSLTSSRNNIIDPTLANFESDSEFTYNSTYWNYNETYDKFIKIEGTAASVVLESPYIELTEGKAYELEVSCYSATDGTLEVILGGNTDNSLYFVDGNNGTITQLIKAGSLNKIEFKANSLYDGQLTSFKVYKRSGGNPYSDLLAYDPSTQLSNMDSNLSSYLTDINNLSPETDWESQHSTVDTQVDMDVSSEVQTAVTQIISELDNADKIFDTAETRAENEVVGSSTGVIADIVSNAITNMETTIDAHHDKATSNASSNVSSIQGNAISNTDQVIDKATTKIMSILNDTDKVLDKVNAGALDDTTSEMNTIISETLSDVQDIMVQQIGDALSGAHSNISNIQQTANNNVTEIIDNASDKIETKIDNLFREGHETSIEQSVQVLARAIDEATSSITGDTIANATSAYETRRKQSFFDSMNRFTGGMADVNAVNSSSFIVGMAILERGFNNDVNKFDADLTIENMQQMVSEFMQTFRQSLNTYAQSHLQELSEYINAHAQSSQLFSEQIGQNLSAQVQTWRATFGGYTEGFRNKLSSYLQSHLQGISEYSNEHSQLSKLHSDQIVQNMANQIQTWSGIFDGYNQQFAQALSQYLQAHLDGLSEYNRTNQVKQGAVSSGIKDVVNMERHKNQLLRDYYSMKHKYHALKLSAEKEEEQRNVELDYLDATWDLSLFQIGGSLLSSGVGGAGYVPNRPSKGASAASGAFSGAAAGGQIGASVPGGGPATAGIGAVIGGIGGYLAGAQ